MLGLVWSIVLEQLDGVLSIEQSVVASKYGTWKLVVAKQTVEKETAWNKKKLKITCVNMVNKIPGYYIMTMLTSKQNEEMIFIIELLEQKIDDVFTLYILL